MMVDHVRIAEMIANTCKPHISKKADGYWTVWDGGWTGPGSVSVTDMGGRSSRMDLEDARHCALVLWTLRCHQVHYGA